MIVSLFLLVTDITGLISYVNLTNSSEYQMAMRLMQAYQPDAASMPLNSGWMLVSSIIGIALNAGTIVVSYALFKRMKWGRISFISLVWIQTAYYILSSIGSYYMAQSFLGNTGMAQMVGGSGILMFGEFAAVLGGLFVVAIAVFIVRKLSSADVRREFSVQ
jgi:fatty-acid desaturase